MAGEEIFIYASNSSPLSPEAITAIAALSAAVLFLLFLLFILIYIYTAFALMKTAKRMKKKNPWLAWIPIANVYLITKMAGLNGWWTLILLACIIPWIGGLIVCGFLIWFFWLICKKRKYPEILSFLLIIPIIGYMILIGILAWGKK